MRTSAVVTSLWIAAVSAGSACARPPAPPASLPVATETSGAHDDLRRLVRSSSVTAREQAVFAIGDLEHPDADSIAAVVSALDDPVASVRLQALAALRRIGRTATVPLLSRIADGSRSPHVDTVEGGCGRVEFVARKGDLAAAALSVVGAVDTDLIWARYLGETGTTKRRLAQAIVTAEIAPSPHVLTTLTSLDDRDRRLLLEPARWGGAETARALAEILSKIRAGVEASKARTIDREIMALLASMPAASPDILRRVAHDTPWPENVVAAFLDVRTRRTVASTDLAGDRVEIVAVAFRAVLSRRGPETFTDLVQSLQAWSFVNPGTRSKLSAAIGEAATLAFLQHPLPARARDRAAFLLATGLFADRPFARPDLIEKARLFGTDPEDEVRYAAYQLLWVLARTATSPRDQDMVWQVVLDTQSTFSRWRMSISLPAPSPAAERAIAARLVEAAAAGRLDPGELTHWSTRGTDTPNSFAEAIRDAALAAEARGVDAPVQYARLLDRLEAEPSARVKALHAVVDSRGPVSDTLWALGRLATDAAERPGVVRHLTGMLRAPGDAQEARTVAEALIEAPAGDLTAGWAVAADVTFPILSRTAASEAVARQVRFSGDQPRLPWIERAIVLLSSGPASSTRIGLDVLKTLAPQAGEGPPGRQGGGDAPWLTGMDELASTNPDVAARLTAVLTLILKGPDPRLAAAAAFVWVSYGFPSEAATLLLQEARHPPEALPQPPAPDLAPLRAWPTGSAEWRVAVSDGLRSPNRRLFCRTVELLPTSGLEAAGPMAELLIAYEKAQESKGIWERFELDVRNVCRQGETLPVTIQRIVKSAAPGAGQAALALALDRLAGERPQAGPAGSSSTPEREEAPRLRPSMPERETFHLEHSKILAEGRGAAAIGVALGSGVVSPLLRHLDGGGRPTNFLAAAALAAFGAPPAMGRSPDGKAYAFAVPDRASLAPADVAALDRLLAALTTRWAELMPVERAALLPLFGGASPTDQATARVLAISLSSPSAGERRRALTVAAGLKLAAPELVAAKDLDEQEDALRGRLDKKLAVAFDNLYPPGVMCMSGRLDRHGLPPFPWPPPAGYRTPEPLSLSLFGGPNTTAGMFFDRLRAAFAEVSPDYEIGLFGGPPDGFAVVARLERIQPDGVPFPGRVRWTSEGRPKLALSELLGDLFLERPGYFRVIAFVVTSQAIFESSARDQLPGVMDGAQIMPAALAGRPLSGLHVFALVYSFERPAGGKLRPWIDGSPSARRHLEASGLWSRFAPKER